MTHPSHAMAHTAHSMHAMGPHMGRSKARSVIDSSHCTHPAVVAPANISRTFAMDLLVVDVLGMRHSLA